MNKRLYATMDITDLVEKADSPIEFYYKRESEGKITFIPTPAIWLGKHIGYDLEYQELMKEGEK